MPIDSLTVSKKGIDFAASSLLCLKRKSWVLDEKFQLCQENTVLSSI